MKYTPLSVNDLNAAERGKENNYYNRIFLLQRILHEMGLRIDLLTLSTIPMIIFFLFMQKYLINGIVAGAVKG